MVRAVALHTAGSIMVHELRYVAAYGRHADQALMEQGHSYFPLLGSLAIILPGRLRRSLGRPVPAGDRDGW